MNVRIVKRPLGDAPENVRDAWIGLLLPVDPRYPYPISRKLGACLPDLKNSMLREDT